MESAITSRLTSEARIPSVPIVTPSEIEIVLNSIGVHPAALIPAFACMASSRWLKLQGIVSIHSVATPMIGRARSSSVNPTALSIALAADFDAPSVSAALILFAGSLGREYTSVTRRTLLAAERRDVRQPIFRRTSRPFGAPAESM